MRITVIDGQGGGIGSQIIKKFRACLPPDEVEIIALGTNAIATSQMMKQGANRGASGENAVVQMAPKSDIIVGTLGIVLANSMMGEVTSKMAEVIAQSAARKVLLPINYCGVDIVGVVSEPLPHMVDSLVERVKQMLKED